MENVPELTPTDWQENPETPNHQETAGMSFLAMDESSTILTDLHFLNYEESSSDTPLMQFVSDASDDTPPDALSLASLAPNSSILNTTFQTQFIRTLFESESLTELSSLGVDVEELEEEGKLKQLSFLVPVKVVLQPSRLAQPVVTLLVPQIGEKGEIWVQIQPYLARIPSEITFFEQQRDAIEAAEPFYCIKRVTLDQGSDEFMDKQDALWRALSYSNTLSVPRSLFEEIVLTLIHRPHHLPEIAIEQRWYEYQRKDYWKALNAQFPWQIGIFNGLTIHFYALASLQSLPHLAGMVKRLIPEEEENNAII